jgi:hypothetical protein
VAEQAAREVSEGVSQRNVARGLEINREELLKEIETQIDRQSKANLTLMTGAQEFKQQIIQMVRSGIQPVIETIAREAAERSVQQATADLGASRKRRLASRVYRWPWLSAIIAAAGIGRRPVGLRLQTVLALVSTVRQGCAADVSPSPLPVWFHSVFAGGRHAAYRPSVCRWFGIRFFWLFGTVYPAVADFGRWPNLAISPALDRIHPVIGPQRHGCHPGRAGQPSRASRFCKQGGNAVDAAVAVGFALAVTLPQAGNLGGGGFMLVPMTRQPKQTEAIDFRETAPAAAGRTLYLNDRAMWMKPGFATAIRRPACRARWPDWRWPTNATVACRGDKLLEPAIAVWPSSGIPVTCGTGAIAAIEARERMAPGQAAGLSFSRSDGSATSPGETLAQPDLAASLKLIAEQGSKAFYEGEIARRLVADMQAHQGLITLDDLKNYRVVVREPVRGSYRGYEIVSMPPPSSGGVHLIQILNMLETGRWPNWAQQRGHRPPDGRGHEAGLCRPQRIPGRSRFRQGAGRRPDLEGLRQGAGGAHRSEPGATGDRDQTRPAAATKASKPPTTRWRTGTATRSP